MICFYFAKFLPKHKISILTPKHNFSGINSPYVSLMLIYAPENPFIPKLASILPCWVTKITKIWFSKMKLSQKIFIWTKKFLFQNMLSYPLTNRKAKKNCNNHHFSGSWGGGSLNATLKDATKLLREKTNCKWFYRVFFWL